MVNYNTVLLQRNQICNHYKTEKNEDKRYTQLLDNS